MGNVCKSNKDTSKPASQATTEIGDGTVKEMNGTTAANLNLTKNKSSDTQMKIGPDIFVTLKGGSIFDVYKEGPVLGQGAYGQVSLVTHRQAGVTRAMKTIDKKAVIKEEAEKMFTEVSILKDLDHPNIVKLFELYQDKNKYYLITEYLPGGELFDRIQKMQSFNEKQAAEYMKQILSAVVYCHSKNVVHRDLKPENLLLTSTKSDATIKVIDFGTSKKFEEGQKMTQKFGTPYYIAPEVLSKNYDQKCDVWSCGVILFIMLCGYPPFNGKSDKDILANVKSGKFSFDEPEWENISEGAKSLITKMLTLNPANRISAAAALQDPWIQKNTKTQPLDKKILGNLSSFSSKNKLKQAILTFIVTQISTEQDKEKLMKTFASLDKDGNGILTTDELIEGYMLMYGGLRDKAEAEARKIIEQVDINHSGQIDFSEFIMAAMNRDMLLSKEKVDKAFHLFDQNGDGFITREEFAAVMGGVELDDKEWDDLMEEVDANKDGKISQKEFIVLMQKMAQKEKI